MRKLLLTLTLTALFVFSVSTLTTKSAFAGEADQKYRDVFYHDGMPMIKGIDGEYRVSEYRFFVEDQLPDSNLRVIVYSEITYSGEDFERVYRPYNVYIALVQDDNQVLSKTKLSDEYGDILEYYEMGATINHLELSPTIEAEHLYLWGVVSGSGGQEFGTDYFFRIDRDNIVLIQVLEIYDTLIYGRAGVGRSRTNEKYIYSDDIDSDGTMEIMTRKCTRIRDDEEGINTETWSDIIDVYRFNESNDRYEPTDQITTLPESAELLVTY